MKLKKIVFSAIVSVVGILAMSGCGSGISEPTGNLNGHGYVDLGLPSGTLWATCNIGATDPEECGDYFAWGETKTKTTYSEENYRYWNNSRSGYAKYYGEIRNNGDFVDNFILEASDDAATANWGENWRMPTIEDFLELAHECSCTLTKISGKEGYIFTGPNNKSIFLPYTGIHYENDYYEDLNGEGDFGNYWTSYLDWGNVRNAWSFRFDLNHWEMTNEDSYRIMGSVIRPVSSQSSANQTSSSKTSSVKETKTKGSCNGHDWVDLGLPSGTKWATCNVGANKPEDDGNYYAWGETRTKSSYTENNYTYSSNPTTLPSSADAATVNWGVGWRMPTKDEFKELKDKCTWKWVSDVGYKIIGPNDNSIFLPAASYLDYIYTDLQDAPPKGFDGFYWSSSLYSDGRAWFLYFYSDNYDMRNECSFVGLSVRPVFNPN